MNKFIESSKIERQKMTELFAKENITEYSFTDENGFDRHDGIFRGRKGKDVVYEVKNRAITSTAYKTAVIDESKYHYLVKTAKEADLIPMVFIFYKDGKYLAQNLLTANTTFTTKLAPRTTAGDNTKVLKRMCEIEITKNNVFSF